MTSDGFQIWTFSSDFLFALRYRIGMDCLMYSIFFPIAIWPSVWIAEHVFQLRYVLRDGLPTMEPEILVYTPVVLN
jgi:hypothetical protein